MSLEFIAIQSTLSFSLFYLFARVAAQRASPFFVNFWANGICAVLLSLFLPFIPHPAGLSAWAWVFLVLAGIASPALAAYFIILGSRRIGVSRTGAIGAGLAPLFSSAIAIFYLGEDPTWRVVTGTALTVGGVVSLALEKSRFGWTWRFLGYPLSAAGCLALAVVFRKMALLEVPAPLFGAVVQSWAGWGFLLLLAPLISKNERFRREPGFLRYLIPAGIFVSASIYFYFRGLEIGDVTLVAPLVHTWPLVVMVISRFFLQSAEDVTPWAIAATVLVISGGYFIVG